MNEVVALDTWENEETTIKKQSKLSKQMLNAVFGLNDKMPEPKKRRLVFVFIFCIATTALLQFIVPHPQGLLGETADEYWYYGLYAIPALFLLALRITHAEQIVGTLYCLWLVAVIGYSPVLTGDAMPIPMLALICAPLILGMISGPTASILGAVSVLSVHSGTSWSALNQFGGLSGDSLTLTICASICTIVTCLVLVYFDNSTTIGTKALQEKYRLIEQQALSDALTRCANRRAFQQTMARLEEGTDNSARHAVIIIDLDRFKQINDTFGHEAGDAVLAVFADRLRTISGPECPVYRLGGDEFAIILETAPSKSALRTFGEQIVSATDTPISTPDASLEFGASIGIAISDGAKEKTGLLYQQADTAAFAAKKRPGSNFVIFDSMLSGAATRKFEVEQCLKSAMQQRSINVAMQPQVDLNTGAVLGFEALARWSDPLLGKICPSEFIPIAEQTSLIEVLDRQVIARALRGASMWLPRHQRISINASARSLNSVEFADFIINQVKRTRLKSTQIELEITETALIENWETSKRTVEKLRAHGIRIALDDFGVGYSSLSYLVEFPIQKIKFDRSFIQKSDDHSAALVMQSIIGLAKKMEVELVAEGIETKEQLRVLKKLGCHTGQGFLLGRPILREDIKKGAKQTYRAA